MWHLFVIKGSMYVGGEMRSVSPYYKKTQFIYSVTCCALQNSNSFLTFFGNLQKQ